ncbi:MAG: hypothetical protein HYW23_02390 [Candidatus Aenigmarchaeota archaeon]|nr:hypothetical protein [Candidatus Aenigmarchaeota archaeon]
MHSYSRKSLLISAFLISLIVVVSSSFAAVVQVNMSPAQTQPNRPIDFSLSVSNLAGDNVNKIEMMLPQQDSLPAYMLKEIGTPAGWTYETRSSVGASPFKVIWSTAGSGISAGNSLNFNFVAVSPSEGGKFEFQTTAVDLKGVEGFGKISVTNFNPVLTSFGVATLNTPTAGTPFQLTVTALDQNGNVKPDYTGTVKFSSSDPLAILPSDYTFQASDNGVKTFTIKLKTEGSQEIKASGSSVEKIIKVDVKQSDVSYIQLKLSNDTALPNTPITLTAWSSDIYDNLKDVTKSSTFSIDKEAKGVFADNVYTTEVTGKWTVIATYTAGGKKLSDGSLLNVVTELPKPVKSQEPEKKASIELQATDAVVVPFNTTKDFLVTVTNTGDVDIQNISLYFTGFPESWISIEPSTVDVNKGSSQKFVVSVSALNYTAPSDVHFVALSNAYSSDKLNASASVKINVTEQVTAGSGRLALSNNLTYLGIAIVAAVVLIILFWALFLREPEKKGGEKKSDA